MKVIHVYNGDNISSRSSWLLSVIDEFYPEIEVVKMDIKDLTQYSGHEWDFVVYDEYSKYPAPRPVAITNRKPKPFYRQRERW